MEVKSAIPFIRKGDIQGFSKLLSEVMLISLSHSRRVCLLLRLLTEIEKECPCRREFIEYVIRKWNGEGDSDITGTLGDICGLAACPYSVIRTLFEIFDVSPSEVIAEQIHSSIEHVPDQFIISVKDTLSRVLGKESIGICEYLYLSTVAEECGRPELAKYFNTLSKPIQYAAIPDWVNVIPGETLDLCDAKTWAHVGDGEESLTYKDFLDKVNVEEGGAELVKSCIGTHEISQQNKDPDRVYGPVNRISERECCSEVIPGGCRMLTCICFEYDQTLDGEEKVNTPDPYGWFTGECIACGKKIRNPSHSLRQAIVGGGWVGCYCSRGCLDEFPLRDMSPEQKALQNVFYNLLKHKGILNREGLA